MNWRLKIRVLMIGAMLLLVQSSNAFWRGKLLEGDLGEPVHESITIEALYNMPINLGNDKTSIFEFSSVEKIAKQNHKADDDQTPSHHFDNDMFTESSQRLIQLRKELVFTLLNPSFLDLSTEGLFSRQPLTTMAHHFAGEALHTLQDFYSHSNWVERNGANQKNLLDIWGKSILTGGSSPTSCDVHDFASSPLTTGWAQNEKVGLIACNRPENKCPHGFVTSCVDGMEPNLDIHPGLNKDYSLRKNHDIARLLAFDATSSFIREILLEALEKSRTNQQWIDEFGAEGAANVGRSAVCHFMGMPEIENSCLTPHLLQVLKQDKETGEDTAKGIVLAELDEIDCGDICEASFVSGSSTKLIASAYGGFNFAKWADDSDVCPGSEEVLCEVTMDSDKTAKAVFVGPTQYSGTFDLNGTWLAGDACNINIAGSVEALLNHSGSSQGTLYFRGTETVDWCSRDATQAAQSFSFPISVNNGNLTGFKQYNYGSSWLITESASGTITDTNVNLTFTRVWEFEGQYSHTVTGPVNMVKVSQ